MQIVTADSNEIVQVLRESCTYYHNGRHRSSPNPDCEKCHGEGDEKIHIADTRNLTGAALLLYGGARKTRGNIEIILRDQNAALTNIARALGMFERIEDKPQDISLTSIELSSDPLEASRIYQQIMRG